jgi:hypothetical protein
MRLWLLIALSGCHTVANDDAQVECPATQPVEGSACSTAYGPCDYVEASTGYDATCECSGEFGDPSGQTTWHCSDCPWTNFSGSAACTQPGTSCEWHSGDDEMECDCSCGSDGYWQCTGETSNSACPGEA